MINMGKKTIKHLLGTEVWHDCSVPKVTYRKGVLRIYLKGLPHLRWLDIDGKDLEKIRKVLKRKA